MNLEVFFVHEKLLISKVVSSSLKNYLQNYHRQQVLIHGKFRKIIGHYKDILKN